MSLFAQSLFQSIDYNPYYKNSTEDYNKGQNDYWAR